MNGRLLGVMAGPVGPTADPLAAAARQGSLALLIVTAGALVLTVLVGRRLTRPLIDEAPLSAFAQS